MWRKCAIACALMAVVGALAFAVPYSQLGYTVQRSYTDNGVTYSDVTDSQGHSFTVGVSGELTQHDATLLQSFVKQMFSFRLVKVDSLRIVFSPGRITAIVIPSSFMYNGVDLAKYMPSGMQFFYTTDFEYDFRLHIGSYFIRFAGPYIDEQTFAARLMEIVKNPKNYLQSQDPAFMLERINTLEKELSNAVESQREMASRVNAVANDVTKLTKETTNLQQDTKGLHKSMDQRTASFQQQIQQKTDAFQQQIQQKTDTFQQQIQDKTTAFEQKTTELKNNHDRLLADYQAYVKKSNTDRASLQKELGLLRYGVMVLHNRGWLFGTIRLPDVKAVDHAVALKEKNPSMTKDELAKQMKADGYDVSGNVLFLVLGLYFNEFK